MHTLGLFNISALFSPLFYTYINGKGFVIRNCLTWFGRLTSPRISMASQQGWNPGQRMVYFQFKLKGLRTRSVVDVTVPLWDWQAGRADIRVQGQEETLMSHFKGTQAGRCPFDLEGWLGFLFYLCSTDLMRPSHMEESNLFYRVSWFKC